MNEGKWIVKQGVMLTILGVIVSCLSFLKETIFANYFGTTYMADAFTIAIQFPEVLFVIVWEGINTILIPLYTDKLYNEGKKAASDFVCNLTTCLLIGIIAFVIISMKYSYNFISIFSPGLPEKSLILAASLFRCVVPILFFECCIRICIGILNVHNNFAIPRLLNGIRNLVLTIFLVLFAKQYGIFTAAFGFLSGMVIESIMYLIFTSKYESYRFYINVKDETLLKACKLVLPVTISMGVMEINQFADKFIASFFSAGSISSLNYASKLSSIIQTLILGNIITLVFPMFSKCIAEENKNDLSKLFLRSINYILLFGIPIIFGGTLLRSEIISIVFERGAFDRESTIIVGNIFIFYLVGTLFTTLQIISVKLFASLYNTKTPMKYSIVGAAMNIFLNVILAKCIGLIGLALASVLSTMFVSLILIAKLKNIVGIESYRSCYTTFFKSLLSSVVMCIGIICIRNIFSYNQLLDDIIDKLLFVSLSIVLGIIIYGVCLYVFKVEEVNEMIKHFKL